MLLLFSIPITIEDVFPTSSMTDRFRQTAKRPFATNAIRNVGDERNSI